MGKLRVAIIPVAVAVLVFGQTSTKKASEPTTKKPTAPLAAKPDAWQRSKECAAQAEKVMAVWDGNPAYSATNHYSPRYEKCFLKRTFSVFDRDKGELVRSTDLIDAFEGAGLATLVAVGQDESCSIDYKKVDCEKAYQFVNERMKN
jgi:invasion protein IalB